MSNLGRLLSVSVFAIVLSFFGYDFLQNSSKALRNVVIEVDNAELITAHSNLHCTAMLQPQDHQIF